MDKEIIYYPHVQGITMAENGMPRQFPSHWHNDAEFTLIEKPGCRFRVGDEILTPEPGDVLLVWPRQLHEILHIPEGGGVMIQFSSRLMESHSDLVAASRFISERHLLSASKDPELCTRVREVTSQVRKLYHSNPTFVETRCKVRIYEMLILIGEHVMQGYREQIGDENFSDKAWEYIRTACGYIADHSAEDLTQAQVAAQTGLSPYYFSKLFHEYTQMTFPAYLSGIRVQNAIHLLASEQVSVTECAFTAGFQSTTTFNKVFREHTGCTPREYRKLHRQSK